MLTMHGSQAHYVIIYTMAHKGKRQRMCWTPLSTQGVGATRQTTGILQILHHICEELRQNTSLSPGECLGRGAPQHP